MVIEIVDRNHIRIKDKSGLSFDIYTFNKEEGIQIIHPDMKPLEVERREPWSIIIREK